MKDWDHFDALFLKQTNRRLEVGFAPALGFVPRVHEARFRPAFERIRPSPFSPHGEISGKSANPALPKPRLRQPQHSCLARSMQT